ncbi:hypothetical protein BLS_009220 [Venturia inaequalis]|uniref:Uncharacterized protein n=1 Tax=Venturia inaequalis TaxID=5025 RepID=A0A8H3U5E3_VENIN|nr:hypothetical protein BLS_009220 [Venturia inaequalis]KAE9966055.1 hypothetical protein EG328_009201 [Venturia inaequalis]
MAMTVACGTSGDGDPPTFAEYDEVVLTPAEAFCGAVDDAAAEDDVDDGDGRGVLVGATDVVATVFATGAVVILYKLMYSAPVFFHSFRLLLSKATAAIALRPVLKAKERIV